MRRGWTTGTCAAAAAKAAYAALVTGEFPDPVEVTLPRGERPSFALALTRQDETSATAGVVKDAGDDPDVTHGALVIATVRAGAPGAGVTFRAGEGVGTVTRRRFAAAARRAGHQSGAAPHDPRRHRGSRRRGRPRRGRRGGDLDPWWRGAGGEDAQRPARNRRRSVDPRHHRHRRAVFVRGVDPLIQRGIDVARAAGLTHIAGSTGSTSEAAVQKLYGLPEIALIDMGDFVGGMLNICARILCRASPSPAASAR